ncbi:hypothetical protein LGM89_13885 [Burkholderia sp. AU31624]|uniref:hypothetical protein n=1 Tax=Burkholderia sp. AU31624 TaxID=2879629 RepID=UPI001CF1F281|nr:hypothetical protein [Burkholderia sp. AU31624]MCA8254359.1 hypothetical protein [Burkholderia sp. AU31624]
MQPVEVQIGIAQAELYAAFIPSTAGVTAAATCGAIPGVGILLAAVCGGALGAVDATTDAIRAKAAEDTVGPLKDQLAELNFDQQMRKSVSRAFRREQDVQVARIELTKEVNDKAYNELYVASKSGSVMFVNVDYHLSPDYSALLLSTRSLLFPRSVEARALAKLPPTVEATTPDNELAVAPKNAVYRASITYRAKLVSPSEDAARNVSAWNADDGRLLRAAMDDGIAQMGRLLTENLQRKHEINGSVTEVTGDNGVLVSLIGKGDAGSLVRYPDGSLQFNANLEVAVANFDAARQTESVSAGPAQVTAPTED